MSPRARRVGDICVWWAGYPQARPLRSGRRRAATPAWWRVHRRDFRGARRSRHCPSAECSHVAQDFGGSAAGGRDRPRVARRLLARAARHSDQIGGPGRPGGPPCRRVPAHRGRPSRLSHRGFRPCAHPRPRHPHASHGRSDGASTRRRPAATCGGRSTGDDTGVDGGRDCPDAEPAPCACHARRRTACPGVWARRRRAGR